MMGIHIQIFCLLEMSIISMMMLNLLILIDCKGIKMNSTRFFPNNDHLEEVRTYICPECWNKVRIVPNEIFGYFGMTLHSTTPNIQLVRTRIS